MSVPFTVDGYRHLVTHLRNAGYLVRSYDSIDASLQHLIVRHDIDFSLKPAVEVAQAEAKLSVQAVYFVALRSEFYNPLTTASRETLAEIRALGHAVGLHFDPRGYETRQVLEKGIAEDAAILAGATGGDVGAVSFHRPPKEHLAGEERLGGLWNAYAHRFIQDVGYCSDSRGEWRHGDPLSHPSVRDGRALQLLTHPIWWTGEEASPAVKLQRFLASRLRDLDGEAGANCAAHVPGIVELSFAKIPN